ncbi:MAG: hypothetical protein LBF86_02780 [Helicobacteraceae bacterium]|jgi:hypothetical protein|nr:hypothetical protein [Helicobacteraceae bacterium]
MQTKRIWLNPIFLIIIAVCSGAIFALYAIETLSAQYFEHNKSKSYFIDTRNFPPLRLDDETLRIIIKSNKIYSFPKRGEFTFGVYKYRNVDLLSSEAPDGVVVKIYADDNLIAQETLNPYADKSAPYIEDGLAKNYDIKFDIPEATQTLIIEFLQNKNNNLDIIAPAKLKAHKANALGSVVASIALLSFIASIIALVFAAIRRRSSNQTIQKIYDYFYDEKKALFVYRSALVILILFVAYFIMVSAGFTFNQEGRFHLPISLDDLFLYHTPRADGRFFPLANTDYNLLWFLPYGFSSQGFYFINLITFIATICAMTYLISQSDKDKIASRYINAFFLIVILLSLNRSIKAFMEIIYPERLLSLTIVIFLLLYKKAYDSDKIAWYVAALLTAIYATYQKEPMFGVFIVFALFSFLFAPKTRNRVAFNAALIINGAIFLLIYYWTTIKLTTSFYRIDENAVTLSEHAALFAKTWLFIILFIFSAVRGWFITVKKDRAHLFYDATLFAACAFVCAYLILGFLNLPRAYYYYAPVAFMFAPSLICWSKYLYFNNRRALFWSIAIALLLSCRVFSLDDEIEARRKNHDFIVALSAYAKLDKRLIVINDDAKYDWQISNLVNLAKYINSKTYALKNKTREINIERLSSSDPIDYDAVYVFLGDINARFTGFRPILTAKASGIGPFTAYIYDER